MESFKIVFLSIFAFLQKQFTVCGISLSFWSVFCDSLILVIIVSGVLRLFKHD